MEGKQKIIDDILASAEKAAKALIAEAETQIAAEKAELEEELAAAEKIAVEKFEAEADGVYNGQIKLGELEASKALLRAKQRCVSAVYDGVRDKILSAPDKEYLALMQKLITSVCENGDEVIICDSDAKRITAAWIKKIGDAVKCKLVLSKTRGDFSGGVILRNGKYDRDLTVDEIVRELKERTIADTVKNLGL